MASVTPCVKFRLRHFYLLLVQKINQSASSQDTVVYLALLPTCFCVLIPVSRVKTERFH